MEICRCWVGSNTSTIRLIVLAAPVSMETGEHKMPGFSGCHGCLDGFIIAHFTEKDHVRTLAEGGAQRNQVTFRICTDLSLADDAFDHVCADIPEDPPG